LKRSFLFEWMVFIAAIMAVPFIFKYVISYPLEPALRAGFFVMLAVSLTLVVGLAGQISLGHGAFFGIGAYTAAILATKLGLPAFLTIPLGTIAGVITGFLIGYPVLKLKSYYLALATLVVAIAVYEFFKAADALTGGEMGLYNLPNIRAGNFELYSPFSHYYVVWIFALLVIFLCDHFSKSPVGKKLKALHSDEEAAECVGIDVFWTKVKVFVLSSTIAAFAGALFAHCSYGTIYPGEFNVNLSIKIITMVVVGGMYSIYGAAAGAIVISLLPEVIRRLGDFFHMDLTQITHINDIVFGIILIIFMIFSPKGILGKKEEKSASGKRSFLPFWGTGSS